MGHVMRCCSLAEAFRQNGWEVFFCSKFYLGGSWIQQKGFPVEILEQKEEERECQEFHFGEEKELDRDMAWMSPYLQKQKPDVIFLDSYNVNDWFFRELKTYTSCLVYLDDLAKWDYPVDVILNPNVDEGEKGYDKFLNQKKHILGSCYNLLREEFSNLPRRRAKKEIGDIFITTGAADPKDMTTVFVNLCQKVCPQAVCHVIVGNAFWKKEEWKKKENSQIRIYESPERMSEIMLRCDVAISAGGSTIYELAACGVPTLAFLYSENQRGAVEYLGKKHCLGNIGEFDKWLKQDRDTMELFLKQWRMLKNQKTRQNIIDNQQKLFPGRGAKRVVQEIEKCV